MCAGGLEELQAAQEVPAVAGRCAGHPEELEAPLSAQMFGSCGGAGGLERVQGAQPLPADAEQRDQAAGAGEGTPGPTQVCGEDEALRLFDS